MHHAMSEISREYGSDAVMLSSRKIKKRGIVNFFSKPYYEIVVAYDPNKTPVALMRKAQQARAQAAAQQEAAPEAEQNPETGAERRRPPGAASRGRAGKKAASGAGSAPTGEAAPEDGEDSGAQTLSGQLDSIQSYLRVFDTRFRQMERNGELTFRPEVEELRGRMLESHVEPELARSIAAEAEAVLSKQEGLPPDKVFRRLIMDQLGSPKPVRLRQQGRKVVMLLGSTGVGKTTSLVKLATHFSLNENKKVGIVNADTYRIAAQEQLRIYADILDIPLGTVYHPEEVTGALEEQKDRDIIFIDTPGKKPGDPQHREALLKLAELSGAEDILLAISAPTSFEACREIIDSYRFLKQYRLLFTKLDETAQCGILLNARWYSGRDLTYLTTGQNVPGDIEPADARKLAERILAGRTDSPQ